MTSEERNLLSVGYKNTVASRRAAWRTLSDIQENEDYRRTKNKDENNVDLVKTYKSRIEGELESYCDQIIALLPNLISSHSDKDSQVFFKKMMGDYYRYLCEIHTAEK